MKLPTSIKTILLFGVFFSLCNANLRAQTGYEKNLGQFKDQNGIENSAVNFLFKADEFNIQLRESGFSFDIFESRETPLEAFDTENVSTERIAPPPARYNRVDIDFVNSNLDTEISSGEEMSLKTHYYTDLGVIENVPFSKSVTFNNLYDNVKLEFTSSEDGKPKYNFHINEASALDNVLMQYSGQDSLKVTDYEIIIYTPLAEIQDTIPLSYFNNVTQASQADVRYVDFGNGLVGLKLISSEQEGELVVDPIPNIKWGTYEGIGTGTYGMATCFTPDLEVVLSGDITAAGLATSGAHDGTYAGGGDAYISKFENTGEKIWTTYYGGTGWDAATDVVSDLDGNIIFTGWFASGTYAASPGALQSTHGGGPWDAVLAKLSPDGIRIWGTFLGGGGDDEGYGLAVNDDGEILLAGSVSSGTAGTAIATPGTHQSSIAGGYDAFVTKFSPDGERIWGTFFGGTANETIYTKFGVDFDQDDNVIIASWTESVNGIATPGAHKTTNQAKDGFIAKFNYLGQLDWATYTGGEGDDLITSVIFDISNNIVVSGGTGSTVGVASTESFQNTKSTGVDGFIQKFNPEGTFLTGTYFGGSGTDFCYEIDNYCNDILIFGTTNSTNLQLSEDTHQDTFGGSKDAFIAMLDDGLESLFWNTYYGGSSSESEYWSVIGMESSSRYGGTEVAVSGSTSSSNQIAYENGNKLSFPGGSAAFLATLEVNHLDLIISSAEEICEGETVELMAETDYPDFYWGDDLGTSETVYVTPLETDTYNLYAATSSGCLFEDSVTIEVHPKPDINLNLSNEQICLGESSTITVSGADSYDWVQDVEHGDVLSPEESGSYTYSVLGTITETGCEDQALISLTVHDLPVVGAIASELSICEGDSLLLAGTGANSYTWSDGVINNTFFYPDVGVESYSVTGVNSSTGCQNSSEIEVEVFALPDVQGVLSEYEICLGDSVLYTGSGAHTYDWEGDIIDGFYSIPEETGTITYELTGIDVITRCQKTVYVDLEVQELPDVTATASENEICLGESLVLNGQGADTYSWNQNVTDDELYEPIDTGILEFLVIGTTTISGCQDSAIVQVTVHELPEVTGTASSVADSLCFGEEVIFSGEGADSYSWSSGIINGEPFSMPNEGTDVLTVIGTNNTTGCQNSDELPIRVFAVPTITAAVDLDSICLGQEVIFSAEGASSYTWNAPIENGVPYSPNSSGNLTFMVTGLDALTGCESTYSVQVTVIANPGVSATSFPDRICFGESIVLSAQGADSYEWPEGVTNGMPFIPENPGEFTYSVIGINEDSECNGQDSVTFIVDTLPEVIALANETEICEGESLTLTGQGADIYAWNNGVSNGIPFTPPSGSLNFEVVGEDEETSCLGVGEIDILVHQKSPLNAGEDSSICEGDEVTLLFEPDDTFISFMWDNEVENGVPFSVFEIGENIFTLTAIDVNNCYSADSIKVHVSDCDTITVLPTGFSPNNDGVNDYLVINGTAGKQVKLNVFSEWGVKLYSSNDYQNDWNGTNETGAAIQKNTKLPVGTYYYVAIVGEEVYRSYLYISY